MKFKIITLGCKVNQYESQAIRESLLNEGFIDAGKDRADIYIVNTCTVTHTADVKSLKSIRRSKAQNPQAKILVTGCLAQTDRERIEAEGVDCIIPQSNKSQILYFFDKRFKSKPQVWSFKISTFERNRAFVKIQDGCDSFCSFCKVRIARGPSRSRSSADILREITQLSSRGFREIVLCGINLAAWKENNRDLSDLLKRILEIKEIGRIRLSSLEPRYINDKLLSLVAADSRLCNHFHIPFQSGSDRILKRMNKDASKRGYYSLIEKIRDRIPDCGISCDIMVGFPGEEEEDFAESLDLIDFCRPVRTHIFGYSARRGTPSFNLRPVACRIVKERLFKAAKVAKSVSFEFRKSLEGKVFQIVPDSNKLGTSMLGYTSNYIRVRVNGSKSRFKAAETKDFLAVKIFDTDYDYSYASLQ